MAYGWSDSTITLAWIKNGNNKDKLSRRRTDEIRKNKEIEARHVRSEDKPADVTLRGVTWAY